VECLFTDLVASRVLDAQPKELVGRWAGSFTSVHGLLKAGPALGHCALLELQSFSNRVPVDLSGLLAQLILRK